MKLTIALLLAGAAFAAPTTCPPVTPLQDTVPLAAGCGLDPFTSTPNRTFWFGWNDNPTQWPGNDWDSDDLHGRAQVNADGTQVTLTYLGSTASYWNTMYYGFDPIFTNFGTPVGATAVIETVPNADIILSLTTVAYWYAFEWSSFDPDHFRAGCLSGCEPPPAQTPEPGTLALVFCGVAALAAGRKSYGKK